MNYLQEEGETDTEHRKDVDVEKYSHLKGTKLQSRLKHHLNKNINNVEKVMYMALLKKDFFPLIL